MFIKVFTNIALLLFIVPVFAGSFTSKDFPIKSGYPVPKEYNWLKFLDSDPNKKELSNASNLINNFPSEDEIRFLKESIEKDTELISSKAILGPDGKEQENFFFKSCRAVDYELTGKNNYLKSDNWKARIRVYTGKKFEKAPSEKKKILLLIPPTGGFSIIDKFYARTFCVSASIKVAILTGWDSDKNSPRSKSLDDEVKSLKLSDIDPRVHDIGAVNAITAIKLMVQFLGVEKEYSIMGNSVGGITSTLAMGLIPQIKSGITVVSGSDLNGIISRSGEKRLSVLRGVRSALWGNINVDEYEYNMGKFINIKPSDYYHNILLEQKPMFMISGSKDSTVPTYYQNQQKELLKEVLKREKEFKANHIGSIISSSLTQKSEIIEFILNQ